jgi:hypothetical protein
MPVPVRQPLSLTLGEEYLLPEPVTELNWQVGVVSEGDPETGFLIGLRTAGPVVWARVPRPVLEDFVAQMRRGLGQ